MIRVFRSIILGAPGSGKGTISSRIIRKFEITHVPTGDILRNHINNKTPLGLMTQQYIKNGELVPDNIIINVVFSELQKLSESNWLLDGFPRTKKQAQLLQEKFPADVVINLIVPFEIIIERIQNRWIHIPSGRVYNVEFNAPKVAGIDDVTGEKLVQRDDDKPTAVQNRLEIYSKSLGPVIEFYKDQGILEEFSGNTTNEIWPMIYKYLKLHMTPISKNIKIANDL